MKSRRKSIRSSPRKRSRKLSSRSPRKRSIRQKLRRKRSYIDGVVGVPTIIPYDVLFKDIYYYFDKSFNYTLHFLIAHTSNTPIGNLGKELFNFDKDDISRVYFNKRNILGFFILHIRPSLNVLLKKFEDDNTCISDLADIPVKCVNNKLYDKDIHYLIEILT